MKKAFTKAEITVSGANITLWQNADGSFLLEKYENGRWFVSTQIGDCFYLQENTEDEEIVEMGTTDNLPEALYKLAWAGH